MTQKEKIDYINYCKDNNIYRIASMLYEIENGCIDDIPLDILKEVTLDLSKKGFN